MAFRDCYWIYCISSQAEYLQVHESYLNFCLLMCPPPPPLAGVGPSLEPRQFFQQSLVKPFMTPQACLCFFSRAPIVLVYIPHDRNLLTVCLPLSHIRLWAAWGKTCVFHLCISSSRKIPNMWYTQEQCFIKYQLSTEVWQFGYSWRLYFFPCIQNYDSYSWGIWEIDLNQIFCHSRGTSLLNK